MTPQFNRRIFEKAKGIKLDVACGPNKQKGCVGMDIHKHPGVDIVQDIQKFPWRVPDNVCTQVIMSHIWEHIEPKYRFQVMDECWRIIRHDGQLFISCPYAGSFLEASHPAHYPCPNEATFQFFDSDYQLWHSCDYRKPLPWRIVRCLVALGGTIEIILEPRKDERGKAPPMPEKPVLPGAVHLIEHKGLEEVEVTMPKRKETNGKRRNKTKRLRKR